MACTGVIRLGDEKTSLQFLVTDCLVDGNIEVLDITNATDIKVGFKHENGYEEEKPGTIYLGGTNGDGTDGIVEYITEVDFITRIQDLDEDTGTLKGIAIITFDTTGPYHSSPSEFTVKDNF